MRTILEEHGKLDTLAAPAKAGNDVEKHGVRIDNEKLIVKEDGKQKSRQSLYSALRYTDFGNIYQQVQRRMMKSM